MRAAITRDRDGFVINVIVVEDLDFPVDKGHTLREALNAGPGWTWNGVGFNLPPPAPPAPTPRQQIINKLRADPVFKAGILDSLEARGITDRNLILDALEAKFSDERI